MVKTMSSTNKPGIAPVSVMRDTTNYDDSAYTKPVIGIPRYYFDDMVARICTAHNIDEINAIVRMLHDAPQCQDVTARSGIVYTGFLMDALGKAVVREYLGPAIVIVDDDAGNAMLGTGEVLGISNTGGRLVMDLDVMSGTQRVSCAPSAVYVPWDGDEVPQH